MNESDYSIKPLQGLPNITGLTPANGSDKQNKRQNTRRRPEKDRLVDVEDEIRELTEVADEAIENDPDNPHIDYCA